MIPIVEALMLAVTGSLAASIAAKATLVTALGLTAARLARRSPAAVRHALLAASFAVLLLLPLASIVAPPIRVALPTASRRQAALAPLSSPARQLPSTSSDASLSAAPQSQSSSSLSLSVLLLAAWIAGALFSLLPLIVGFWKVRSLRSSGLPWPAGQSLVDALARDAGIRRRVEVLFHRDLPGPMTFGVIRPVIVLSPDAQTWPELELTRALVHELDHVRRADWLSQCLVRVAGALYWFHPLVRIAWRQLALEAERSCDDAVLSRSEPTAYAHQLVVLARRLSRAANPPVLAMANRADLATRIGAVLDGRQRRGRAGALPIALASAAAATLLLAMSPLTVVAGPQSASSQNAPEFDAVSVKLVDANMRGSHFHSDSDPKRLSLTATTHALIIQAYGITNGQIGAEPDWFKSSLYSVEAVSAAPASDEQMMLMLRRLLADRFQLKLRQDNRELPVFALEVAPGGPKFKELQPGQDAQDKTAPPGAVARSFASMSEFMNALNGGGSMSQDVPVIDRTHLTGSYNMQLVTETETEKDAFGRRSVHFPSLFRDVQAQLGLKFVSDRVRMPYFTVEKATPPSAN